MSVLLGIREYDILNRKKEENVILINLQFFYNSFKVEEHPQGITSS